MTDKTSKPWMSIGETDDPKAKIESYLAAADIGKGDPVFLSADDQVSPAIAAQECIGIATKTVTAGNPTPILIHGRVKIKAGAAITRGKAVYGADANKRLLMLTDQAVAEGGAANYTIYYNHKLGTALESATAADDLIFINAER